jgi:hypothetical protein
LQILKKKKTPVVVFNRCTMTEVTTETETAMPFDVTDKVWQLHGKFSPDKESAWSHPKEKDGWVLAHDALRHDLQALISTLETMQARKSPFGDWQAGCFQKAWNGHFHFIHMHHNNEDHILAPVLKTRFKYPDKVQKMCCSCLT